MPFAADDRAQSKACSDWALAADGLSLRAIAKDVGVQPRIFSLWRQRHSDYGLEGLAAKARLGRKPPYTAAADKRIMSQLIMSQLAFII